MIRSHSRFFTLTRAVTLIGGLMIVCQGFASNVVWNTFLLEKEFIGDGYGIYPYPYMTMRSSISGNSLVLQADAYEYMEFASSWVLANKGDEVSVAEMQKQSSYFYSADFSVSEEPGLVHTDYSISVEKGKSVYLAVISRMFDTPDEYDVGWVELYYGTDGALIAKSSALDRDGGSLIVGAIPEPTSALLLLLGGAALLLRRRRRL